MFRRVDGIVDFDKSICIGCKACMAACPYDAIFINPEDHSAEKCNFCAHRIDMGLEPACVVVCPTEAILIGDIHDPLSRVAQIVNREPVTTRRPEKETLPKLFYKGAHQTTLDPLAARRPEGGLFMWSEQLEGPEMVVSGNPTFNNSSAAALLSYDVPHAIPWDWRVSLYTWTKGLATGAYLVPMLMVMFGLMKVDSILWLWAAPIVSGVFLAATGALLIWDLEHPSRFYLIFTKPQWKSWLVKGAFIIAGYSLVLAVHFVSSLLGYKKPQQWLVIAGLPFAVLTAVYTAYLFAQAKARDLWQNPLLPPHLFIQAILLGAAVLSPLAFRFEDSHVNTLQWIVCVASVLHLLVVWGEMTLTHSTAHARLAVWEMTRGRFSPYFWASAVLTVLGGLAPWLGIGAAPLAVTGVLLYEHAYVQAGQAVPLA
jgi:ferredoxin/formate-dependent nitrite reductase membrane component NrfD